jgi:hypothetical protein
MELYTDGTGNGQRAAIPALAAFDPERTPAPASGGPSFQVLRDRLALRLDPKPGRNLPAALRSC